MTVYQAIRARRSIRKYVPGAPLLQEDLHTILEAAMMAPSARNGRPWEFVVVRSPAVKEQIRQAHPYCAYITDASAAIVVCGRPSPEEQKEGERGEFWPQDCAAAIENLMLQALELGYGTVWCGLYPVKDRCDAIREIIGVDSVPMAIVLVGRPDEAPDARGYFDPTRVKEID